MHNNEIARKFLRIMRKASTLLLALFWITLIFCFDDMHFACATLLSAAIHEIGHGLYILILTGKFCNPYPVIHGLKMRSERIFSYKEETILYISGPLANFLIGVPLLIFGLNSQFFIREFAIVNILTGLSNLLPIDGYDGYGIANSILKSILPHETVERILSAISFIITLLLCLLSLYIIDRFGESFWIFAVFSFSMVEKLSKLTKTVKKEKK